MAITFPRVEEVAPGDRITSRQLASLADGINARIRSGLGDCAFRIAYYWYAAARQFRMPNVDGSYPPMAEFFQSLQMQAEDADFPVGAPGELGGLNTASLIPLYVYGRGSSLPSEATAFGDPEEGGIPMEMAVDAEQLWDLAKRQRGAYDPATGDFASPSFDAARHVYRLVYAPTSVHGNAYGGFMPTPEYLGTCADGTSDTPASPDYDLFFTKVSTGDETHFDGTCPDEPTHVAGIWATPIEYWVILNNGTTYRFPRGEYIEGPYRSGNVLRKTAGEHLPRILNRFIGEFRGDETRIAEEHDGKKPWLRDAFQTASFFTTPYYLSPAVGQTVGDSVRPIYPTGKRVGPPIAEGTIGTVTASAGNWLVSGIIRASNLAGAVPVSFVSDGVTLGSGTLTPTDGTGAIVIPFSSGVSTVDIVLGATAGGEDVEIEWEVAEVMEYRPGLHDLWVLLRLSGAQRSGTIDGSGRYTTNALEMWEAYRDFGVIPKLADENAFPDDVDERTINGNAVFDTFRRASRVVRCITREQIRGYAVEDGKSVIWLDPYAPSLNGLPAADTLSGIRDEIATEAPEGGYTNEWVAFPQFKAYHPSGTSLWAPETYSDFFANSDRCAFYMPSSSSIELRRHFNSADPTRGSLSLAPEVATGMRYARNLNFGASEEFFRSCRIYEPPMEIESAVTEASGEVKVTFTARMHHHHSLAPATLDRDPASWDMADLLAETQDYRTDENALRDYLARIHDGSRHCEYTGPGNAAFSSTVQLLPDNPFGTCYPTFWLVKMLPAPYADGNDSAGGNDTAFAHDVMATAETYIRAMCEGFVDGQSSQDYGCATGVMAVYDYTFANLCYDAFGGTSITTMPTAETDRIEADEVRDEAPLGYGPLPTVIAASETWNQYARAVNKLDRVRVTLPFDLQVQSRTDTTTRTTPATNTVGTAGDCGILTRGFYSDIDGGGIPPTTITTPYTGPSTTVSASNTIVYQTGVAFDCSGSDFVVQNAVQEDDYKFEYTDPSAEYAVPEDWRDMIPGATETLWEITETVFRLTHTIEDSGPGNTCNGAGSFEITPGILWYYVVDETTPTVTCEFLPSIGTVEMPILGNVRLWGAMNGIPCTTAQYTTRQMEKIISDALILRIPLEDSEVES